MSEKTPDTRTYVAEHDGRIHHVEATGHPAVRAHVIRKITREIRQKLTIRLAQYGDGIESVAQGIPLEVARDEPAAIDGVSEVPADAGEA